MSPEEQRIAIAEACGWKRKTGNWNRSTSGNDCFGILPRKEIWTEWYEKAGRCFQAYHLPDYPSDLNAIHEAEKVLTNDQWDTFLYNLAEVIGRNHRAWYSVTATAAKRAEAFLRTIGKWKD